MPSFGGPPDMISLSGTECTEKSVFHPRVLNGTLAADPAAPSVRSTWDSAAPQETKATKPNDIKEYIDRCTFMIFPSSWVLSAFSE